MALLLMLVASPVATQEAPAGDPGRVTGQVIDASTGRMLPLAQVIVVETQQRAVTDTNGRYRTAPLPPGDYTIRVESLGYARAEQTVTVTPGETSLLDFAMSTEALAVEGLTIEVDAAAETGSVNALLAAQRAAPTVSDGISAEQMSRSVSSDAGDAIARVTGVSVVDNKFVVVRGLAERYSTTTLNGAELASPEPTKRIVPMDVFPASLLESVVTTKAATPDRPGDFAGGSVDIKTKEFPEDRVFEVKLSQGFDNLTTLRRVPMLELSGRDYFAFDGQERYPAGEISEEQSFAKALRNEWTPRLSRQAPNLGLGFTIGDQVGEFERALGYVLSVDYGRSAKYDPNVFFAFVDDVQSGDFLLEGLSEQSTTTVDWGGVANLALRLGSSHTLTLKNLATREAEERFISRIGTDPEIQAGTEFGEQIRNTQARYLTRTLIQSQLGGRHFLDWLGGSTADWKGSFTYAGRDEPENRTLSQIFNGAAGRWEVNGTEENPYWFRFLDEGTYTAQADWLTPFSLRSAGDLQVKVGALARFRRRSFDADLFNLTPVPTPPDGRDVYALEPEFLTQPENIGRNVVWTRKVTAGLPYDAEDDVYAAYGMLDVSPLDRLRLVGGLRVEQWKLLVEVPNVADQVRDNTDYLWSANATYRLTDRQNFRLSAFRTVSRPDPRELSITSYSEVTNECSAEGNPRLERARILNGDLRWEWFPDAGELISISGFYKRFEDPFIQVVSVSSLNCLLRPENADSADNYGAEVELRKGLGFIAEMLDPLSISVNVTYTDGAVTPKESNRVGDADLPLIDQSPWIGNAALTWLDLDAGFELSVLAQHVGERVRRYGDQTFDQATGSFFRTPDSFELERTTIDARISKQFGPLSASVSASNLTAEPVETVQGTVVAGDVPTSFRTGVRAFSLSLGYRIW